MSHPDRVKRSLSLRLSQALAIADTRWLDPRTTPIIDKMPTNLHLLQADPRRTSYQTALLLPFI
jgi:hypothetical protein